MSSQRSVVATTACLLAVVTSWSCCKVCFVQGFVEPKLHCCVETTTRRIRTVPHVWHRRQQQLLGDVVSKRKQAEKLCFRRSMAGSRQELTVTLSSQSQIQRRGTSNGASPEENPDESKTDPAFVYQHYLSRAWFLFSRVLKGPFGLVLAMTLGCNFMSAKAIAFVTMVLARATNLTRDFASTCASLARPPLWLSVKVLLQLMRIPLPLAEQQYVRVCRAAEQMQFFSFFNNYVAGAIVEEVIFRFLIYRQVPRVYRWVQDKVHKFIPGRDTSQEKVQLTRWFGYETWDVVSSLLFAAFHFHNYDPPIGWDWPKIRVEDIVPHSDALSAACARVTVALLVSLEMLTPMFKGHLIASIIYHVIWIIFPNYVSLMVFLGLQKRQGEIWNKDRKNKASPV